MRGLGLETYNTDFGFRKAFASFVVRDRFDRLTRRSSLSCAIA
jgi:hypothetical protein